MKSVALPCARSPLGVTGLAPTSACNEWDERGRICSGQGSAQPTPY